MENENNIGLMSPGKLKITVSGKKGSGKSTLLGILKNCLERDYAFRTLFQNWEIKTEEKVEDLEIEEAESKPLTNKELANLEDKVDQEDEVSDNKD